MRVILLALLCLALAQDTPTASPTNAEKPTQAQPASNATPQPQAETAAAHSQTQQHSPPLPTEADALKNSLGKPTRLKLTDLLPSDSSTTIIEWSLLAMLVLFVGIQVAGAVCGRRRKRYSEKFEEYTQRTEVEEATE